MSDNTSDKNQLEDTRGDPNSNNNNYHSNNRHPGGSRVDPENDPPYSRLFVICGKTATEEDLEREFKTIGPLQSLKIVHDKTTNESKGVAYVKYDKASTAAIAIEVLNGKKISEEQSPLKVMIADAKGSHKSPASRNPQSREPEDLPPRSRLFVICSKDFSEEDLTERFKQFGDFESCKVIKDKQTNEHKGYAYAKFSKSSTAALAMEEVNKNAQENGLKLKALIADPKSKNKMENQSMSVGYPQMSMAPMAFGYAPGPPPDHHVLGGGIPAYPLPQYISRQRLFVVCHKSVTHDQLARLFSRFPGMEYCDLKKNKQTDQSKGFAYINYSSPQTAMLAKEQMDGYEFPYGSHLKVMFAEPLGMSAGVPPTIGGGNVNSGSVGSNVGSNAGAKPSLASHHSSEPPAISAIRDSFAQMMSYPPYPTATGVVIGGPGVVVGPAGVSPNTNVVPPTHAGAVPHMQPQQVTDNAQTNDRNFPEGSRLFIVLSKAVPDYVLQEMFSRYGALEYVRLQKDKNYGYAKYTTAGAASYALQCLNNQEIQGQKITITVAHPPTDSRKRPRI